MFNKITQHIIFWILIVYLFGNSCNVQSSNEIDKERLRVFISDFEKKFNNVACSTDTIKERNFINQYFTDEFISIDNDLSFLNNRINSSISYYYVRDYLDSIRTYFSNFSIQLDTLGFIAKSKYQDELLRIQVKIRRTISYRLNDSIDHVKSDTVFISLITNNKEGTISYLKINKIGIIPNEGIDISRIAKPVNHKIDSLLFYLNLVSSDLADSIDKSRYLKILSNYFTKTGYLEIHDAAKNEDSKYQIKDYMYRLDSIKPVKIQLNCFTFCTYSNFKKGSDGKYYAEYLLYNDVKNDSSGNLTVRKISSFKKEAEFRGLERYNLIVKVKIYEIKEKPY